MDIAQTTLENDIEFDYIYPSLSLSLSGAGVVGSNLLDTL